MKIYDTLSRDKKDLPLPDDHKKINLFVCGPTVYDDAHIGHARTYIFFDFLAKYLRAQGYDVSYLQNITDIDDKIIKRAAELGKDPLALAKEFTESYFADMKALGVDAVTHYAPATEFIPEIVSQVQRLIEKGFAYKIENDGWYFDISKDPDYGALSGRTVAQAEDGVSRIDDSVSKKNKGDFCLWKFWSGSDTEPKWDSELGAGRPGWHIEDTAITEKYFGARYDIHGGGVDLKFPHHEAEMAQQISAAGIRPEAFVNIWMHTGALLVDGKKMSKSLGNFITIKDFLKKYSSSVLRLLVFRHDYRSPMDYSEAAAEEAVKNLSDLAIFARKLKMVAAGTSTDVVAKTEFSTVLSDDINTHEAIAQIFKFVSNNNDKIWTLEDAGRHAVKFHNFLSAFGIVLDDPEIPQEIQEKATERELSRAHKQFEQSDALRAEINALGYEVEDTSFGPFLWPKRNEDRRIS